MPSKQGYQLLIHVRGLHRTSMCVEPRPSGWELGLGDLAPRIPLVCRPEESSNLGASVGRELIRNGTGMRL